MTLLFYFHFHTNFATQRSRMDTSLLSSKISHARLFTFQADGASGFSYKYAAVNILYAVACINNMFSLMFTT